MKKRFLPREKEHLPLFSRSNSADNLLSRLSLKAGPLLCTCAVAITLETQKGRRKAPRSVEFNFFINCERQKRRTKEEGVYKTVPNDVKKGGKFPPVFVVWTTQLLHKKLFEFKGFRTVKINKRTTNCQKKVVDARPRGHHPLALTVTSPRVCPCLKVMFRSTFTAALAALPNRMLQQTVWFCRTPFPSSFFLFGPGFDRQLQFCICTTSNIQLTSFRFQQARFHLMQISTTFPVFRFFLFFVENPL